MTAQELLDRLAKHSEIDILDERSVKGGTRVLTFSSVLPFPKSGPVWYSMVVKSDAEDIAHETIEAMLRHLWMFQIDLS